jgi:ribosome-binding factor A
MEKIAALLKEELGKFITQELADPSLGFVTVTEVRPAPDLSTANVYVSVLGDERREREVMKVLHRAARHIQFAVSERVLLRRFPTLFFRIDDRIKRSIRISRVLNELAEERQERATDNATDTDDEADQ